MRNQRLVPAFRHDSEILEILQQLFILGDRENDRRPLAVFVGEILKGLAHTNNLSFKSLWCRPRTFYLPTDHGAAQDQHLRQVTFAAVSVVYTASFLPATTAPKDPSLGGACW